jgi:hypothetical protein
MADKKELNDSITLEIAHLLHIQGVATVITDGKYFELKEED